MASSQGGLAARRVRTLLLAAAKEDRWLRQDLLLRSEDEEWMEECVAEAAKPWYRTLSLSLSLSLSLTLALTLPLTLPLPLPRTLTLTLNPNPNQVPSGSEPE